MAEENTTTTEETSGADEAAQQAQAATEARAKRMGWVPEDDFRGPKENWVDAETFIERGENELPILRERNRALDKRLESTEAALTEVNQTLKEFKGHYTRVEQRAYDRAVADLKAKQRQAVEDGDAEAFDAIDQEIEDLRKEATPAKPKGEDTTTTTTAPDPEKAPDFVAWKTENPWYDTDLDMAVYADQAAATLSRQQPDLKGKAFFDKVTEAVRGRFPDKFSNPRRRDAAHVEGAGDAGGGGGGGGGGKTYADLPPEGKAACDRFVKQGLMTKEQYVSDYEWS